MTSWPIIILGIIFFLVRLPSFSIIPTLPYINTHNFFRILVIILIFSTFLLRKENKSEKKNLTIPILVLLFFISQSISVVTTENIQNYILFYKDIIFSVGIFIVSSIIIGKKNYSFAIRFLILGTLFNTILESFLYTFPVSGKSFFQLFLTDKSLSYFLFQASRYKFFGDSLDETMIPVILVLISQSKNAIQKNILIGFILLIGITCFLSNWRTKFVLFFLSFILSFVFSWNYFKKFLTYFILICFFSLFVTKFFGYTGQKTNIFQSLNPFDIENTSTVQTRIDYWKESIVIIKSSPLFGVGVGNFYDNLSSASQQKSQSDTLNRFKNYIRIEDPHNVFISVAVNSGLIGLFIFICLIINMLRLDFLIMKSKNELLKALSISSWLVIIFLLFNPFTSTPQLLFFLLRGIIQGVVSN